jgi:two-component system phosphate regulon response regulator OmpR
MQNIKILSVDSDEEFQGSLQGYLVKDGYSVITEKDGTGLMQRLETEPVDLVLLELDLQDNSDFALIQNIRAKSKAGIIIVSGKWEMTDKVVGLEMGADDYITKPFEMRELTARIRAVLRRIWAEPPAVEEGKAPLPLMPVQAPPAPQAQGARVIPVGDWQMDCDRYELLDSNGKSAELTTGEFRLLEALVMASGKTLTREHLFELTRDGEFDAYDRAVDTQIARLRRKLGENPQSPSLIKTVRGVGYMFCGKAGDSCSAAGSQPLQRVSF